ncbi:APC family permease [Lysinimonas soli]|uniref:APC family permease n=1 Tax=Lysinimonas soli TaxID=1074233 RepID=A0ABW0NN59_9MICO
MTQIAPPSDTLDVPKKLGLLGVIMPGLAQVAPAFNLFFTTGVIASLAGASVPLVFLISTVGFLATGLSLAQFSSVYPSAGSFVTYISRTFGSAVGTATGVITVLGYMITFAGIYIFVGDYIVTNVFLVTGSHVALTIITTIVYGAIVTVPVILGLQFGVRVTIVLYLIEVVVLLVISFSVLFQGGSNGLSGAAFSWPAGAGATNIFLAFSLAVVAFGGFEASAPLAEETANPRRNVPIALVGSVLISGIVYVLGSWAVVSAFGNDGAKVAKDGNPFATAASGFLHIAMPIMVPILAAVFLVSVTSSYIAANTQTSRVIFAGARGGLWPRALSSTQPRFKTPWAAAIAFVAPSIVVGVLSTIVTDPGTTVGFLSTFGIFGVVVMYTVTNVALFVQWFHFRKRGVAKNPFLWLVVPVIGVAVLAIPLWGNLRPGQGGAFDWLPLWSIGLVVVGIVYTVVLAITRPKVLAAAPALLEGAESLETDPLPPAS